jgi:hypothetical protein
MVNTGVYRTHQQTAHSILCLLAALRLLVFSSAGRAAAAVVTYGFL